MFEFTHRNFSIKLEAIDGIARKAVCRYEISNNGRTTAGYSLLTPFMTLLNGLRDVNADIQLRQSDSLHSSPKTAQLFIPYLSNRLVAAFSPNLFANFAQITSSAQVNIQVSSTTTEVVSISGAIDYTFELLDRQLHLSSHPPVASEPAFNCRIHETMDTSLLPQMIRDLDEFISFFDTEELFEYGRKVKQTATQTPKKPGYQLPKPDQSSIKAARKLAQKLKFDKTTIDAILPEARVEFTFTVLERRLRSHDRETPPRPSEPVSKMRLRGITFGINDTRDLEQLRGRLPQGYTAFAYESVSPPRGTTPFKLTYKAILLHLVNETDFVAIMGPESDSLTTEEIVQQIIAWQDRHPLAVYEATRESMTLKFEPITDPNARKLLIEEIFELCAEIEYMSADSHRRTDEALQTHGFINFWWD